VAATTRERQARGMSAIGSFGCFAVAPGATGSLDCFTVAP
jgi:hypothetical protein